MLNLNEIPPYIQPYESNFSYEEIFKTKKIHENDNIEKEKPILTIGTNQYNHTNIFTSSNISGIVGKAKSKKTFLTSLLTAAVNAKNSYFMDKFYSHNSRKIVYFDTEQGLFHSQRVLRRILRLNNGISSDNKLDWFNLRTIKTADRYSFIKKYIENEQPSFVIIDGLRDLISDINNQDTVVELINTLMALSSNFHCHICNILHQNPNDTKPRGWLGTELMNKAETIIEVEKIDKETTCVKPFMMRDKEFDEFFFSIDSEGLPYITTYVRPKKEKREPKNDEDIPF